VVNTPLLGRVDHDDDQTVAIPWSSGRSTVATPEWPARYRWVCVQEVCQIQVDISKLRIECVTDCRTPTGFQFAGSYATPVRHVCAEHHGNKDQRSEAVAPGP
jgi:hypothetical protein